MFHIFILWCLLKNLLDQSRIIYFCGKYIIPYISQENILYIIKNLFVISGKFIFIYHFFDIFKINFSKIMKILLINPPFSQINTVYPAILQLAGFLKKNNYETICLDLSNKTFLKIFSSSGLSLIFNSLSKNKLDENLKRIISLKEKYIGIIDNIISFLQGKDNSLAYIFANPANLPQAKYFENINYEILEKEFGSLGIIDKAKYFCSLVIDDLVFFIKENISPFYELSKYAEKLAESNRDFDILYNETKRECNIIENFMLDILNKQISTLNPNFVAISIPFPGNLLSSLIIGKYIKNNYPEIKIIFGGGYINTELREIQEERIFEWRCICT